MWKRLAGKILFNASLFAAGVGLARMIFGVEIESPSGHSIPLGSSDLWAPFSIAIILFALAAAIRPPGTPRPNASSPAPADESKPAGAALGAGLPDLEPRARVVTPQPATNPLNPRSRP